MFFLVRICGKGAQRTLSHSARVRIRLSVLWRDSAPVHEASFSTDARKRYEDPH